MDQILLKVGKQSFQNKPFFFFRNEAKKFKNVAKILGPHKVSPNNLLTYYSWAMNLIIYYFLFLLEQVWTKLLSCSFSLVNYNAFKIYNMATFLVVGSTYQLAGLACEIEKCIVNILKIITSQKWGGGWRYLYD